MRQTWETSREMTSMPRIMRTSAALCPLRRARQEGHHWSPPLGKLPDAKTSTASCMPVVEPSRTRACICPTQRFSLTGLDHLYPAALDGSTGVTAWRGFSPSSPPFHFPTQVQLSCEIPTSDIKRNPSTRHHLPRNARPSKANCSSRSQSPTVNKATRQGQPGCHHLTLPDIDTDAQSLQ